MMPLHVAEKLSPQHTAMET